MVTLLIALQIWCLSKVRTRPTGRKGEILNFFLTFSLNAHNYYPAYDQIFLTEKSRHYEILFMKTFYKVVNSIICCAKEACASIVLDIE